MVRTTLLATAAPAPHGERTQTLDHYHADSFNDVRQLKEYGAAVKDAYSEALRGVIVRDRLQTVQLAQTTFGVPN